MSPADAVYADNGLTVVPATAGRWPHLETLFGKNGANGGCWCMFWRLPRADYKALKGDGTKAVLRDLTVTGQEPGLLAYIDETAVGWCSLGPREDFAALENSRILKRVDDQPVWSIVCFFVARANRRQGVTTALLHGAVNYARAQGAQIVEGYPIDLQSPQLHGQQLTSYSGYMGLAGVFREVGFQEVGRASATQLIMRRVV